MPGVASVSTRRRAATMARSEATGCDRLACRTAYPVARPMCRRASLPRLDVCGEPGTVVSVPLRRGALPSDPARLTRTERTIDNRHRIRAGRLLHLGESLCVVEPGVDCSDDVLFGGDPVWEQLLEERVAVDRPVAARPSARGGSGRAGWSPPSGAGGRRC